MFVAMNNQVFELPFSTTPEHTS